MKKLIFTLFIGLLLLQINACMEVDNFDEPEAHLTGRIIDSTTGENILADQGECHVRIWEMSYSLNPGSQDIPIKQDGSYNNSKLFNGTYDVVPEGAWWPVDTIRDLGIGRNTVTQDFVVTPYLKLIDFSCVYENDSLTVSCRLDVPPIVEDLPQILDIRPFLSLNQYCGTANAISFYSSQDEYKTNIRSTWERLPKDTDGKSLPYTFRVWVKPEYIYFVRMGARVNDTFQNYNYTEIVQVEIPAASE